MPFGVPGKGVPKYRQGGGSAPKISAPDPYSDTEAAAAASLFSVPEELMGTEIKLGHVTQRGPRPTATGPYGAWKHAWGGIAGATPGDFEPGVPLGRALQGLYSMSSSDVTALQEQLKAGGFYGTKESDGPDTPGVADEATVKAYQRALMRTVAYGGKKGLADVLDEARINTKLQGPADKVKPPLAISLTNPDELKVTVDAVARQAIGRKLTPDELNHFVESFHSMEANSQRQHYDIAYGGGTEGSFTDAPSAQTFAVSQLQQEHPQEANTVQFQQGVDVFDELLKAAK